MAINSDQIWDGDTIAWSVIKNSNLCAEPEEEEKMEEKKKKEKEKKKILWEIMERKESPFSREWPENNT